jgi:hypothetical protein
MPDVAVRIPIKKLDIELRVQTKVFVPVIPAPDTVYKVGPGFDAILRWRVHDVVQPFSSTFFEYIVGDTVAAQVVPRPPGTPPYRKVRPGPIPHCVRAAGGSS